MIDLTEREVMHDAVDVLPESVPDGHFAKDREVALRAVRSSMSHTSPDAPSRRLRYPSRILSGDATSGKSNIVLPPSLLLSAAIRCRLRIRCSGRTLVDDRPDFPRKLIRLRYVQRLLRCVAVVRVIVALAQVVRRERGHGLQPSDVGLISDVRRERHNGPMILVSWRLRSSAFVSEIPGGRTPSPQSPVSHDPSSTDYPGSLPPPLPRNGVACYIFSARSGVID